MVYAKDTNARIEKRREDSEIAAINSAGYQKRPSKTSYQKKEFQRFEKGKSNVKNKFGDKNKDKCNYCGKGRHPSNGKYFVWKEFPSENLTHTAAR